MAVRPVLVAVDPDPGALELTRHELEKRYGADYEICCEQTAEAALSTLERLHRQGRAVALVLVDRTLDPALLARCRELHPTAKRALLLAPDDFEATGAIAHALAVGSVDGFLGKPVPPAELFHRAVTEFLEGWTWSYGSWPRTLRLVGDPLSPRVHECRDIFARASVPYEFHAAGSEEGRELLESYGLGYDRLPVVVVYGRALVDPDTQELADALSGGLELDAAGYDLAVVGAGPAGLGAAVYAASEGLHTLVLDQGPFGGQAGTSSLIRNYLGFPTGIAGDQLARRAYSQAVLFGASFLFGRQLVGLRRDGAGLELVLSDGARVRSRTALLATGVEWRRLGVPGLEERLGAGVYYGAANAEAPGFAGEEVYVVGGGNSAGQAALHLARFAARVTVLVRSESLTKSMSQYLVRQLEAARNVRVLTRTVVVDGEGRGRLERLVLAERGSGEGETVPAAGLFVLIGAEPRTAWLPPQLVRDERGFVLTGPDLPEDAWPLERPPLLLETSVPGVFAAGDVRHGSVKRVAAAVGDGALAVQLCHQYLAAARREVGAPVPAGAEREVRGA